MSQTVGAITYPKGFKAAGVRAGIKRKNEDVAVIFTDKPSCAAGVFTTNVVKAAPVLLSKTRVPSSQIQAIIVNSGNANACTGEQGMLDAREMANYAAELLGLRDEQVLISSTGLIGEKLPMDKLRLGIEKAVESLDISDGGSTARAIMTTDTRPKEDTVEFELNGVSVRIGGIAKGAGMICPNMATMLSFITTDAAISPDMLEIALRRSVEISFNCLTIDGDTSTNDTVLILANGMAENTKIEAEGSEFDAFQSALDSVTISLARQIASDGEGATKLVDVIVKGGKTFDDCRQVAKTIANSPLVKTAVFGKDPNWGRILAAAGRSGVDFDPIEVNLYFGKTPIVEKGEPIQFDEKEMVDYLSQPEVEIVLEIGRGEYEATVWTCDFSYDYVKINAEYHT